MQNDLDPKGLGETEGERLCRERAMSQWEASTKRPDLDERARVLGAIQAYQRQAFVFRHLSATVPAGDGELVDRVKVLEKALRETIELAEECEGRLDTHDSTAVGFDARIRAIRTALEAALSRAD